MKKGKDILIFVLINIIVIVLTVILPLVPAFNCYKAYHHDVQKVGENSFAENIGIVAKELETQDTKDSLWAIIEHGVENRGEVFYDGFVCVYVMLGIMLGIASIVIGLILKYKSQNKIYSIAFITAGMLVVVLYIFILSILLQKNVYYSLY